MKRQIPAMPFVFDMAHSQDIRVNDADFNDRILQLLINFLST